MRPVDRILKFALIALIVFFMGCASKDLPDKKAFSDYEKWKKLAEHTQPYSPSQRKVNINGIKRKSKQELIQEVKAPIDKEKLKSKTRIPERKLPKVLVSLQMHEVDVGVLFRTLAKAADVNIKGIVISFRRFVGSCSIV